MILFVRICTAKSLLLVSAQKLEISVHAKVRLTGYSWLPVRYLMIVTPTEVSSDKEDETLEISVMLY